MSKALLILLCAFGGTFPLKGLALNSVTLIDTLTCSELPENLDKKISAQSSFEKDQKNELKCPSHADQMLRVFLENYTQEKPLLLTHINIFDREGNHNLQQWQSSIKRLKALPKQLVIIALGEHFDKFKDLSLPSKHFYVVAAGQNNLTYQKSDKLWPQQLVIEKKINGLIIGSYMGDNKQGQSSLFINPNLIYKEQANYFFPNSGQGNSFKGSSYATAIAAANLLKHCGKRKQEEWEQCLKDKIKDLRTLDQTIIYTY